MNNKHLGEKINSGQQQDDHKMSRMETMNEEASRLIGGGGQNQSMLSQGWFERLTSRDRTLNSEGPQQQQNYHFTNQQNQLPQQHLALQLSLMRQTSSGQKSQTAQFQHVDALANHANSTQALLNNLPSYLGLQQLSAAFGLPALGNPAARLQFQDLPRAQGPVAASMQLGNESISILRPSTVTDYIPQTEERTISEGSSIVPCRARGMPKDHNAQTAYFVLPKDVKHGDGLRCSHVQCQNKGIKFVYCKICDVPVAKINFSTRHKHGEVKASRRDTDESSRGGIKRTASEALQKAEAIDMASVEIYSREGSVDGVPFPTRRRRQQHNNRQPSTLDAQLVVDF